MLGILQPVRNAFWGREGSGFCYEALRKECGGRGHQLYRYVTGGKKIICEISHIQQDRIPSII